MIPGRPKPSSTACWPISWGRRRPRSRRPGKRPAASSPRPSPRFRSARTTAIMPSSWNGAAIRPATLPPSFRHPRLRLDPGDRRRSGRGPRGPHPGRRLGRPAVRAGRRSRQGRRNPGRSVPPSEQKRWKELVTACGQAAHLALLLRTLPLGASFRTGRDGGSGRRRTGVVSHAAAAREWEELASCVFYKPFTERLRMHTNAFHWSLELPKVKAEAERLAGIAAPVADPPRIRPRTLRHRSRFLKSGFPRPASPFRPPV